MRDGTGRTVSLGGATIVGRHLPGLPAKAGSVEGGSPAPLSRGYPAAVAAAPGSCWVGVPLRRLS
jgi:hypothetical protein